MLDEKLGDNESLEAFLDRKCDAYLSTGMAWQYAMQLIRTKDVSDQSIKQLLVGLGHLAPHLP